jgi:uncharacterized protein YxeA
MKKVIIGILVVVIVLIGVFAYFRINENSTYKSKGHLLIEKVEEYKSKNKRLPKLLKEVHFRC